jgi:SAM-dependent methyltransferase
MKVDAQRAPSYLRTQELVADDGIFVRPDAQQTTYRRQWEDEAVGDHVASAIGRGLGGDDEFATLTAKVTPLWARFPAGLEVENVLEIGSGYGRIPLYLAHERGLTWSSYCAVDISENMLRLLLEYGRRFELVPVDRLTPLCVSADSLPLESDSFDLVLSSAVFLHMGKEHVLRALAEIARVLRPGGSFVFDVSFPNARNPASLVPRLKPARLRPPHFMKYWTREEVEAALRDSGLAAKAGPFTIEPGGYALLPKNIGPVPVPLARRLNAAVGSSPGAFRHRLAVSYNAFSTELIER